MRGKLSTEIGSHVTNCNCTSSVYVCFQNNFMNGKEVHESVLRNHDLLFRWTDGKRASEKLNNTTSLYKTENWKLWMLLVENQLWNHVSCNLIAQPTVVDDLNQFSLIFASLWLSSRHEVFIKFTTRMHDVRAQFICIVKGLSSYLLRI